MNSFRVVYFWQARGSHVTRQESSYLSSPEVYHMYKSASVVSGWCASYAVRNSAPRCAPDTQVT